MGAIPVVSDGNTILAAHHDAVATEMNGPWTAYTPALTASTTNPTLGSGSVATGRWKALATGLVMFQARIVFGTSGALAGSGTYSVSLPPVNANTTIPVALSDAAVFDSSSNIRNLAVLVITGALTAQLWVHGATGAITNGTPWTWAASDQLNYCGLYEPA